MISVVISALVTLVVPKLIGIEEYGYWQLYLFYSSYIGFLHFGWNDGIYLKYGGKEYNDLDKRLFFSQFYMLVSLQLLLMIFIFTLSNIFSTDDNKLFIFRMVALCMVIVNARYMLLYILQATNRIKEYAQITITDRILYCCLIIVFLTLGIREYKLLIIADLIGKFISLTYAMRCCRDIVFRSISNLCFNFKEALDNINVGIKLMFANIASMLIIGVIRFSIERFWSISVFGKVSLTLSISNFLLTFINAIGLVMFPVLRRTDTKRLSSVYVSMRDSLMVIVMGALIFYYPAKVVLSAWLPNYADSLTYMAILFPICVYEGKMALLVNTYLKTLRKERLMLNINLISLSLSVVLSFISAAIFNNLNFTVLSIVIVLVFRCVLGEVFVSKIIKISVSKDILLELIMTGVFIISGWYINSWLTTFIYATAYIVYLIIKRKEIFSTIRNIKAVTGV